MVNDRGAGPEFDRILQLRHGFEPVKNFQSRSDNYPDRSPSIPNKIKSKKIP
jgi:hypothetical protein